jgi:hypothetical protein
MLARYRNQFAGILRGIAKYPRSYRRCTADPDYARAQSPRPDCRASSRLRGCTLTSPCAFRLILPNIRASLQAYAANRALEVPESPLQPLVPSLARMNRLRPRSCPASSASLHHPLDLTSAFQFSQFFGFIDRVTSATAATPLLLSALYTRVPIRR